MAPPEAATTVLSANGLKVRYNDVVVLNGATLTLASGEAVGLVGRNGSGKSTLLKILAGIRSPDAGEIHTRKGLRSAYLPQDLPLDPKATVRNAIESGSQDILDLLSRFENPGPKDSIDDIESQIQAVDGWMLQNRIEIAREELRLPDLDTKIAPLSGGERRRIAIARSLVANPDLLLLDEPTNHLDPEAIEWIANYLRSFEGAALFVTHDRYFLEEVTTSIAELATGIIHTYEGSFSDFLEAKAERLAHAERVEENRQSFLRREIEWIRRGPKARTTKSKSRIQRFEEAEAAEGPEREMSLELVIPKPPQLGARIIELNEVSLAFGDKELFHDFSFNFEHKSRVGICGRNGLGKSTLLKLIIGELSPDQGNVRLGELTQINYVDQGRLELNEENTLLQELSADSETIQFGGQKLSSRAYLKRFLFTDDRLACPVKILSGGERSRLLLAKILMRGGNVLILDEPTNDLDLPTLQVLEEAILQFEGVVIVVSHDRYFLNRICTHILGFEGQGKIRVCAGAYEDYVAQRKRQNADQAAAANPRPKPAASSKPEAKPEPKPKKKGLKYFEQQELEGLEGKILEAEAQVEAYEAKFADPEAHGVTPDQFESLNTELQEAQQIVAALYQRWEELEAKR